MEKRLFLNWWIVQKVYSLWFLFYGIATMLVTLKVFTEFLPTPSWRFVPPASESMTPERVVVVTGGPRGIAYKLAQTFLRLNFVVIMGCRNVTSSQKKVEEMSENGVCTNKIHLLPLNLKSMAATKKFADGVLKITSRIDFLINNAGIMMTPFEITEDGYEAQFQVNHLSHFLLTSLLLPTIQDTAKELDDDTSSCRIISTTSIYHLAGSLDLNNLESRKMYAPAKCYFDSKLCQVIFTKSLERILQQEINANVHAYALHPGTIPTELWSEGSSLHNLLGYILKSLLPVPTIEDGADAIVHACLSTKLEMNGGAYLERLDLAEPNCQANNLQLQDDLWKKSALLCGPLYKGK